MYAAVTIGSMLGQHIAPEKTGVVAIRARVRNIYLTFTTLFVGLS